MNVLLSFLHGDIDGIPNIDCDYIKSLVEKTSPTDYNELLKIVGFAHGSTVWAENADELFSESRMTLAEIPAFCEDIYNEINDRLIGNGVYEDGFAYKVAKKTKNGSYALNGMVDNGTVSALLSLGFSLDFIFFILFSQDTCYSFYDHHTSKCVKPHKRKDMQLKAACQIRIYSINLSRQFRQSHNLRLHLHPEDNRLD